MPASWPEKNPESNPETHPSPSTRPDEVTAIDRLPPSSLPEEVLRDYSTIGLSLKAHPISFLREQLDKSRILTAAEIKDASRCPHGHHAAVAGIVLFRQQPATAGGVVFMTIEDETARADLIIRPHITRAFRPAVVHARTVIAQGRIERNNQVVHLLVQKIEELNPTPTPPPFRSRDFR